MKRLYIFVMTLCVMALTCLAGSCGSSVGVPATGMVKYTSTSDPVLAVMVDSVDYRRDLTRVYGRIVGRPHTSGRVDDVSLVAGKDAWDATDIDGVDFRRYFQWEDDGVIAIEIDFPALKPLKIARMVFKTVRGEAVTIINQK